MKFTKSITTAAATGLAAATLLGGLAFSATSAAAAETSGNATTGAGTVQVIFEETGKGKYHYLADPRQKGQFRYYFDTAATITEARAAAPSYTVVPVDGGYNLLRNGRCVTGSNILRDEASGKACAVVRYSDGELQMREGWNGELDFAGIEGVKMLEILPNTPRQFHFGFSTKGDSYAGVGHLTYVGNAAGLVPPVAAAAR